jgi:nitrate/TMAO reductase-like tetraheme cytochrome c subunit
VADNGNGNGIERIEEDGSRPDPLAIDNWRSVFGAVIAAISATVTIFLLVIDLFTAEATGYAGLALLPPVLVFLFGCGLVAAGWIREKRRQRRGEYSSFLDRIDLDPQRFVRSTGRWALLLGISLATVGLLVVGASSVAVVEFSESNTFCTDACHAVMGPEASAYEMTAHSQIACVDCHVGSGAEGFLEAKIGGLRQLWAVTAGTVRRPIPTPIHGDNINRQLCERCHSPDRDIGYKALTRHYYLNGMEDASIELAMVVKVGGAEKGLIEGGGIHYHMLAAERVEYFARDSQRQDIALVRVTSEDGSVREYEKESEPLTEGEKTSMELRAMECIDCHSRPAHAFRSPIDSVNEAIRLERFPEDLFYVKEASVRALDGEYGSVPEAMEGIETSVHEYYDYEDPDVLEDRPEDIAEVIELLRDIYRETIFPEMKADWTTHPNNLGHLDSLGCFRCHNAEMVDREGTAIFSDCTKCHAILAQDQESIQTMADFASGMGFSHPQDGKTFEEFKYCSDCHTGGNAVYEE